MRLKRGLLGVLGAFAVGVSLGAGASAPAYAQDDADIALIRQAFPAEIVELCSAILDTKTVKEFEESTFAMNAFNNDSDRCHELALRWYSLLNGEDDQTGSIGDDNTGYTFQ